MVFRLVGDLHTTGMPAWLGWDGGLFEGDPSALAAVEEYLHEHPLVPVTPTGPFLPADRSDPVCAAAVILNVFARPELVVGELPALPDGDVPEDADA